MKPKQRPGILAAMKQYLADAAPGGILNPEVTPQGILDTAALATAPVPGLGDILGLTADVNRYRTDPKSRTLGNLGLTGIGLLPLIPNLTVWHGSPHRFAPTKANPLGEFSPEKIGTGEGAQAFGYGHYVAENPGVAKGYRSNLSYKDAVRQFREELPDDAGFEEVMDLVNRGQVSESKANVLRELEKNDWLGFDYPAQAITAAFREMKNFDVTPELRDAVKNYGVLYKADLADEAIPRMLDWDKPLSEQPELIATLKKSKSKVVRDTVSGLEAKGFNYDNGLGPYSGDALVRILSYNLTGTPNSKKASEALAKAGIPGIGYLDQGSRAAGEGTRNFVVFPGNEGILKILERQ